MEAKEETEYDKKIQFFGTIRPIFNSNETSEKKIENIYIKTK